MKCCAIIPVYNHGAAIGTVLRAVLAHDLPCVLVDDGSGADCASVLDALAVQYPERVTLERLAHNQGKGGAVMAGMRVAQRLGYSHVLQIDADGQHETADIPAFLTLATQYPERLICGCPLYDASIPRGRLYGRYLTHVWVWINTLSFDIRDSMCGFRIYPLQPALQLIATARLGQRMDFDIEILVRLFWRGMRIVNQPTRVRYPDDGVSHFRAWLDNALISRTHARLFCGMLLRLPTLLARKVRLA